MCMSLLIKTEKKLELLETKNFIGWLDYINYLNVFFLS